jgi:hypothetical protein
MRPHGKTKLGFFPLPVVEAARLKNSLACPLEFSALDPWVGDGVAFVPHCEDSPRSVALWAVGQDAAIEIR